MNTDEHGRQVELNAIRVSRRSAQFPDTKNPTSLGRWGENQRIAAGAAFVAYFAKTIFATWALAREAAFLWTTPDLTALSMADT